MPRKCIVCIDLGTTSNKAAIVSIDGEILAKNSEESKLYYPGPGLNDLDPSFTKLSKIEELPVPQNSEGI